VLVATLWGHLMMMTTTVSCVTLVPAGQNRLLALNYIYHGEDLSVCAAHAKWGEAFQEQHLSQLLPEIRPSDRAHRKGQPLRVGQSMTLCQLQPRH